MDWLYSYALLYQLRLFHFSNQSLTIINYAQAEEEKKKKKKLTKAEKEARLKYKDKVTQKDANPLVLLALND